MTKNTTFHPGFAPSEAKVLIAICAKLNGELEPTPPATQPPLPV